MADISKADRQVLNWLYTFNGGAHNLKEALRDLRKLTDPYILKYRGTGKKFIHTLRTSRTLNAAAVSWTPSKGLLRRHEEKFITPISIAVEGAMKKCLYGEKTIKEVVKLVTLFLRSKQ